MGGAVSTTTIHPYDERRREDVLGLLTDAYATAPINLALVGDTGDSRMRCLRLLFELRLQIMSGEKLVAVHDDRVVGFAHWIQHPLPESPPQGPPSATQQLLAALPERVLGRLVTLIREWQHRDLVAPHSHLGPIAVAPSQQGAGIGRRFMERYCAGLDARGETAYLETDRSENVRFFSNYGFALSSQAEVLGVRNWFMTRPGR